MLMDSPISSLKIALAQIDVIPGQPELNITKMLDYIAQAKAQQVDIIAFPEMCIGGYCVGDHWTETDFGLNLMEYHEDIRNASQGICVIFGNIFVHQAIYRIPPAPNSEYHPNKDGRVRKYNAAYVFYNGEPVQRSKEATVSKILPMGMEPKTLLPNYREFDDERYFFSAQDIAKDYGIPLNVLLQPFEIPTKAGIVKVGVEICEDLWCEEYRQNLQPVDPTKILVQNGAQLIINISASPWTYGKNGARDRRILFLKKEIGKDFCPFLYVNNIGAQNNGKNVITFDGATTIYNNKGEPILFGKAYTEELLIINGNNLFQTGKKREEKSKIAQKYDAIMTGIQHLRNIRGIKSTDPPLKFVIGISGGIDSAVVSSLLVQAVGKSNVMGVNLPSRHNTSETQSIAQKIAQALDIPYLTIPIIELNEINVRIVESAKFTDENVSLSILNRENIQAKIRGTCILSNLGAKYGALFTCNGNKIEVALGYATLYGDVNGAIAPIGDLTKAEVYALGKYLNDEIYHQEIIPKELFPNALFQYQNEKYRPSPELKDNQFSPMKWGYHDALVEFAFCDYQKHGPETVMQWYLDGTLEGNLQISTELLDRWGLLEPKVFIEDLEWFIKALYTNTFKRVQAPPIIITSKSAFGYDIRESQLPWTPTRRFNRLKAEILRLSHYIPKKDA